MSGEKLSVRINKKQDEAQDIASFELVAAGGSDLPPFAPGAHIDVYVAGLVRQYSLCNGPEDAGRYVIAVKKEIDSRGGSRAMHEELHEGDLINIGAPRNNFHLDQSARHTLLLAGGIGVTPILSMARHLLAAGASFELHYFTRSIAHTAFHSLLSGPEFKGKVNFHYALEPERLGATLHRLLWKRPEGGQLYLCGPRPFMDLVETSAAAGWSPESVHLEYFAADPQSLAGAQEAFQVRLARSGGTYDIPAGKTIVQALAEQGVTIDTSCEQGVCGTCLTGVLEGIPDHRDAFLTEDEQRACDKIMPCVSRAKTPLLVLDL